jgi:hypothetical protein
MARTCNNLSLFLKNISKSKGVLASLSPSALKTGKSSKGKEVLSLSAPKTGESSKGKGVSASPSLSAPKKASKKKDNLALVDNLTLEPKVYLGNKLRALTNLAIKQNKEFLHVKVIKTKWTSDRQLTAGYFRC